MEHRPFIDEFPITTSSLISFHDRTSVAMFDYWSVNINGGFIILDASRIPRDTCNWENKYGWEEARPDDKDTIYINMT